MGQQYLCISDLLNMISISKIVVKVECWFSFRISGCLFSWLEERQSDSRVALDAKKAQWRRELGTNTQPFKMLKSIKLLSIILNICQ